MTSATANALNNVTDELERIGAGLNNNFDQIEGLPIAELAKFYFSLKEAYDRLDTARKAIYAVQDRINKGTFPEKLDEEDVDMIRVPEIARSFGFTTQLSASIIDKVEGYQWLRDQGQGDLIQPTVNASTLASFAKYMINEEGKDLPPELFKITTYRRTTVNKYTPK